MALRVDDPHGDRETCSDRAQPRSTASAPAISVRPSRLAFRTDRRTVRSVGQDALQTGYPTGPRHEGGNHVGCRASVPANARVGGTRHAFGKAVPARYKDRYNPRYRPRYSGRDNACDSACYSVCASARAARPRTRFSST